MRFSCKSCLEHIELMYILFWSAVPLTYFDPLHSVHKLLGTCVQLQSHSHNNYYLRLNKSYDALATRPIYCFLILIEDTNRVSLYAYKII